MPGRVIRRLFESLDCLEKSIREAKAALAKKDPIPFDLLRRVSNYEEVVSKQRKLAQELCKHVVSENWEEVARHTKLIHAFSSMIHADARTLTESILAGADISTAPELHA